MNEELNMLLANVQSLLQEIKQLTGGGTQSDVQQPTQSTPDTTQASMSKSLTQTESDGVTANDSAEDRLEGDEPDPTPDNTKAVAKSIIDQLVSKLTPVQPAIVPIQKSEMDILSEVTNVLTQLAKSQKQILQKQETTDTAIINVLKGLGIADEVEKAVQLEQTQKKVQKGLNNPEDLTQLANLFKSIMGTTPQQSEENKPETPAERQNYIYKSLRDPVFMNNFLRSGNK